MPRIDMKKHHKLGFAAVLGLEAYARSHNPRRLYELIKLRASLLNGCAHCIAMHTEALQKDGESQRRIDALGGELGADDFSAPELAALALTDQVTRLGEGGVSDEVWDEAARHFSPQELGNLVIAIATINVWNRVAIAIRMDE